MSTRTWNHVNKNACISATEATGFTHKQIQQEIARYQVKAANKEKSQVFVAKDFIGRCTKKLQLLIAIAPAAKHQKRKQSAIVIVPTLESFLLSPVRTSSLLSFQG